MRIEVRIAGDVVIMSLSGRFLAGSDGPYLRQKVKDLLDAGTRKFIVDFSEVPYIDSTGLGFLAGSRVTSQNAGARMVLASLNPHVRKILDDVNLAQFFVIAPDKAAALAMVNEAGPLAQGTPQSPARESQGKDRPIRSSES